MTTQLIFQNTKLTVVSHNNQAYITSSDLAQALEYNDASAVNRIYTRHSDEFTADMVCSVNLTDLKMPQYEQRIFSLRGAHLIAMFARTPVAKEFRKWVLNILDKEVRENTQPNLPLVEPEPTYDTHTTAKEIHELVWLLFSHEQMRGLLEHLYKPLEAIGSRYSGAVYGNYTEYRRHYDKCQPILKRFVAQLKADNPKAFESLQYRLTAQ